MMDQKINSVVKVKLLIKKSEFQVEQNHKRPKQQQ